MVLPQDQALVRLETFPSGDAEELLGMADLQIDKLSPFPEEETAAGTETLEGSESESLVALAIVKADAVERAGAPFLALGALSPAGVLARGMDLASRQGDRRVLELLRQFGAEACEMPEGIAVRKGALRGIELDAAQNPDLVPVLSVVAAAAEGETRVFNAGRLRWKLAQISPPRASGK